MKTSVLAVIATLSLLNACATSPVTLNEAKQVPTNQIYKEFETPRNEKAEVTFVRDIGLTGSAIAIHLYIDAEKVASLYQGEKVSFVLEPGEHIFGVIPTNVFNTHALSTIDQDLKPNRKYVYRILTDGNSLKTTVQRMSSSAE